MHLLTKKTIYRTRILILSIYIAFCAVIISKYQLSILVSILLFLAGGGLVLLLDPLLKPILNWRAKKISKQQLIIDKHINIAKKSNKKDFYLGPDKEHTVWARNLVEASTIYNAHVRPKVIKHPTKVFYYISKDCNNVN